MLYLVLKTLHVLAAVVFLGTGFGSAWYKLRAGLTRDVAAAAWIDAEVVRADWIFTIPAGLLLPATGLGMTLGYGMPLSTPWVLQGLLGYAVAGLAWLPAAGLQLRMRRLSAEALREGRPLPERWRRDQRLWAALGLPAFAAAAAVVWVMVSKRGF